MAALSLLGAGGFMPEVQQGPRGLIRPQPTPRWTDPAAEQMTRQRIRQSLREEHRASYRLPFNARSRKKYPLIPRAERRRLASAFALGEWRKLRTALAGKLDKAGA